MTGKANLKTTLIDGQLTREEALAALSASALASTNALPDALLACQRPEEKQRIIADRDTCQLAYTNALVRSLRHNGPLFEQTAADLEAAARKVSRAARKIETAAEAIGLFADLVRLSSKLALAFA